MLKRGFRLLLDKRDFAALMGAQFAAQAGDGIVQVALAKLIAFGSQKGFDIEEARSPDELLRIVLYLFIPYTIISPFLGVVIDRWDRRRLLFLANGLRAIVLIVVALAGTSTVPDGLLFGAFLLTLASTRIVLATKAAALPATVGDENLTEGNAVSQLGGAIFQLGGAGVAVVAAKSLDAEPIVIAGCLVYLLGAAIALGVKHSGEVRARGSLLEEFGGVVRNIGQGVREVSRTPKAAAAITTYFWIRLLWSFSIVAISFIARELLADQDLLILIITGGAGAAGAVLGFLTAAKVRARARSGGQVALMGSAVAGLSVAVLGAFEMKAALGLLTFFLGFGFFLGKISLDTMVQEALGDDFRGRAFSLYDIAYNLAWVVAATVMKIAWTGEAQGGLLAGMGVVFLVGLGLLAAWFKRAGLLATQT